MDRLHASKSGTLSGLIAAPFTPMDPSGELNLEMIDRLVEALVADGVKGAFVCGTTGESLSLTVEERKAIAERWIEASGGRLKIIVHAGHPCLQDAKELVRHAASAGADAVSVMPPSFFRPATLADLVDWCAAVAAEAPKTPFYYYHIPEMTGVTFRMIDFLEQAEGSIPTLAGIKFTHWDLMDFAACASFNNGRYAMLIGKDEILLSALVAGARGAVGSTYNYAAPVYLQVIKALEEGDVHKAQEAQLKAVQMIRTISNYGGLPAQKAIMKMRGLDCGPARPPLRNLSPAEYQRLQEELAALGVVPRA